MRSAVTALAFALLMLPQAADAQELDVTRRAYTFLDSRLDVNVLANAPGVLHVVRGERGRIEVAARSRDGFAGFGLGGSPTRQLRLTAVGSERVQYLVVVPEHVAVRVLLPTGGSVSLAPRAPAGTYTWGDTDPVATRAAELPLPTTGAGLFIAHAATWAPSVVDIPDLASVRSVSVRFEGGTFRVAASRPLSVTPGSRTHMALQVGGEPLDLVLFVPRGAAPFTLRSGGTRIAQSIAGRPQAICRNVVIQNPTADQTWLTFYPQAGQLDCR
jgi:hypothetical protein